MRALFPLDPSTTALDGALVGSVLLVPHIKRRRTETVLQSANIVATWAGLGAKRVPSLGTGRALGADANRAAESA